jgi:ATP-dependent protease HslVU (ClpYQ) peptidase subunit
MTCIVGVADGRKVWMGGDTCGSNFSFKLEVVHPKVFVREVVTGTKKEKVLIGGCGSFRMLQLLEYSLKMPKLKKGQAFVEWLVTDFADATRKHFSDKGLAMVSNNVVQIDQGGSSFLIGFKGQLYHMYSDFQAFAATNREACAGSGATFAMGSLHTSRNLEWAPEMRIESALQAAADLNPFVAGPFNILSI